MKSPRLFSFFPALLLASTSAACGTAGGGSPAPVSIGHHADDAAVAIDDWNNAAVISPT